MPVKLPRCNPGGLVVDPAPAQLVFIAQVVIERYNRIVIIGESRDGECDRAHWNLLALHSDGALIVLRGCRNVFLKG